MHLFQEKYRFPGWLGAVLTVGFLTAGIAAYIASRDAIRQDIAEQALPLTGDSIHSEIQKDLLRPASVSSMMAHDTFVRDWMLKGEGDTAQIVRYLSEIRQQHNAIASFLVSDRTHRYYYADGVLKPVRESEPRDQWFFRMRNMKAPYEIRVDAGAADTGTPTVFIHHRVLDDDGNFIGIAGIGVKLDTMAHVIDRYRERFHRNIYFADTQGTIVLAGKTMKPMRDSIHYLPGVRSIAAAMLNQSAAPTQLEYQHDQATVLVNSRFIPELGWYLVVEQDADDAVKPIQQALMLNLGIGAAVIILALAMTLFAVNRYQERLDSVIATDALTGSLSRPAFEIVFRQALADVSRTGQPLSAIVFDIDLFQRINDTYGHLSGNHVISAVAQLARNAVRESDIVARWGGEKFIVVLRNCPLDAACKLAEGLRGTIANHDFALGKSYDPLSVSVGIAEYAWQESQADFLARADKALRDAKAAGRNRIQVSPAQLVGDPVGAY